MAQLLRRHSVTRVVGGGGRAGSVVPLLCSWQVELQKVNLLSSCQEMKTGQCKMNENKVDLKYLAPSGWDPGTSARACWAEAEVLFLPQSSICPLSCASHTLIQDGGYQELIWKRRCQAERPRSESRRDARAAELQAPDGEGMRVLVGPHAAGQARFSCGALPPLFVQDLDQLDSQFLKTAEAS